MGFFSTFSSSVFSFGNYSQERCVQELSVFPCVLMLHSRSSKSTQSSFERVLVRYFGLFGVWRLKLKVPEYTPQLCWHSLLCSCVEREMMSRLLKLMLEFDLQLMYSLHSAKTVSSTLLKFLILLNFLSDNKINKIIFLTWYLFL